MGAVFGWRIVWVGGLGTVWAAPAEPDQPQPCSRTPKASHGQQQLLRLSWFSHGAEPEQGRALPSADLSICPDLLKQANFICQSYWESHPTTSLCLQVCREISFKC